MFQRLALSHGWIRRMRRGTLMRPLRNVMLGMAAGAKDRWEPGSAPTDLEQSYGRTEAWISAWTAGSIVT
jgi:hypothetical protein